MAVLTRYKSTVHSLVTDLTNIQNAVGLTNSLTYQPVVGSNYISTATSVLNASELLDAALHDVSDELSGEVQRATAAEEYLLDMLSAEILRATHAEDYIKTQLAAVLAGAPETGDTLKELYDMIIAQSTGSVQDFEGALL